MSGLPFRSGAVPAVVDGFQPRLVPELESLVSGGVVLSGLGGVGKTQTAAEYAGRASVDLLGWVTAASRSSLVSGLAELGAVVTGSVVEDAERGARRFLDWCASTDRPWLVVFDDLADPADVKDLWPTTGSTGRLVVTTRRNERWALQTATRRLVSLDVFTEAQSAAYLRGVLGDAPGADDLAVLLGQLPLALSQAAAYLEMTPGTTCGTYIAKWRGTPLREMFPDEDGGSETVAKTWAISIDAADNLAPAGLARPMLSVMSMLDPNGIPLPVLTAEPILTYLSTGSGETVGVDEAARALGALRRLNLITVDTEPSGPIARVHALVQQVSRERLPAERWALLTRLVADAVLASWPDVERDTEHAAMLRANTVVLAEFGGGHLWQSGCHELLLRAGRSLGEAGQVRAGVSYFQSLRAAAEQHLGPDHPDTFRTRNSTGYWQRQAGDLAGSYDTVVRLYADRLRVLGPDHPDTLTSRSNLARQLDKAGKLAEAAEAFTDLLADRIRILGPDHPDTFTSRSNLARQLGRTGDAAGAVHALASLLDDRTRVLGPDHPDTLTTRNNLAYWRGVAGHSGVAEAFAELLVDRLRVLGPDHPHTLATRSNLAIYQGKSGDAAGAAHALAELLADRLRVLGPDHPATLATRQKLALWRRRAGLIDE
ncbi:tetratricopeptide repeat protein [Actinokineospora diospyrosa]|uniref:Tetratricopeptide repeat-containing protein n=1 Tax=Actinokineospora diospyrosa TaxID=103728 RepID=A0ABT1IIU0_9PSEU|nr:tetratricopeptide repeat protein [Actinokineospora diospyrosa]MCP2272577.1 Tetratricopeptide repeat-containing protein [Actinokineospora diospyrosa]